jgi:FKBP-type peptidyl-prolyl cis-trans isomerase (trigger factor)
MRKFRRCLAVILLLSLVAALFVGCAGEKNEVDGLDYSSVDLESCVKLGKYTGLEIEIAKGESKSTAVWKLTVDGAEVLDYPEAALEYYIDQAELRYKHYAEEGGLEYSELLESLGVSEADIEAEAKKYVKEDLVQLAVLRAEGIALTDDEKIKLLDRYVKKYVDDYGYSEDYVRKNLTDEIYKSMLFDKMLEYLMLKNTFTVKE